MSCSTCDDLRRQLREAHDEIKAWEANSADDASAAVNGERLARWRQRLGAPPAVCRALMCLADRAGRPQGKDRIIAATRQAAGQREVEARDALAGVYIFHARAKLKAGGFSVRINTLWGQGWVMHPCSAARLLASMGDVQASEAGDD